MKIRKLFLIFLLLSLLPLPGEGVSASTAEDPAVRVGLFLPEAGTGVSSLVLSSPQGFLFPFTGETSLTLSPGQDGSLAVKAKNGKLLLRHDGDKPLSLQGKDGCITLPLGGKECQIPGVLSVSVHEGKLRVICTLDLETYTKCVMGCEIGTSASVEVRRAFSLLVRTVALHGRKHQAEGADVCATTCCQVFLGNDKRDKENDAIVDTTKGQYVTYKGEPITCLYHHSNGGATCSSAAAWGGTVLPYLVSVPLKESQDFPSKAWEKTFTQKELARRFPALKESLLSLTIHARDPYGSDYVTLLTAADGQGNTLQVKTSEKIRSTLSLPTGNFSFFYQLTAPAVTAEGNAREQALLGYIDGDGNYVPFASFAEHPLTSGGTAGADTLVFYGKGAGHGVGFSSQGAEQLAAEGVKYPELIAFYFPGTEIANLLNGF